MFFFIRRGNIFFQADIYWVRIKKLKFNKKASKDTVKQSTSLTSKASAKTESFYINNSASKGTVYKSFPNAKSVRKAIPIVAISDKEENLTTKDVTLNQIYSNFYLISI